MLDAWSRTAWEPRLEGAPERTYQAARRRLPAARFGRDVPMFVVRTFVRMIECRLAPAGLVAAPGLIDELLGIFPRGEHTLRAAGCTRFARTALTRLRRGRKWYARALKPAPSFADPPEDGAPEENEESNVGEDNDNRVRCRLVSGDQHSPTRHLQLR